MTCQRISGWNQHKDEAQNEIQISPAANRDSRRSSLSENKYLLPLTPGSRPVRCQQAADGENMLCTLVYLFWINVGIEDQNDCLFASVSFRLQG